MGEREQRAFVISDVEVRADDNGSPKVSGYFIEWNKLSNPIGGWFREQFAKGSFRNLSDDIKALWQHEETMPLGRTGKNLTIYEDDRGARFELVPNTAISWVADAVESIRSGIVDQMSFMFRSHKEQWDETNPQMPIRTILEADLYEVSPVTFPAYPQTSVGVRSEREVFESYAAQRAAGDKPVLKSTEIPRKRLELAAKL